MRLRLIIAAGLGLSLAGAAAAAPIPGPHSWGRSDITFLQYRTDAAECAYQALSAVKPQPGAQPSPVLRFGTDGGIDPYETMYANVLQQRQTEALATKRVVDEMQTAVAACLKSRGYRPFRLLPDQQARLKALKPGAPSRQEYLYSLAVDPTVIRAQGL